MTLDRVSKSYTSVDGKHHVVAEIYASTVPDAFPKTGADVAGLQDNDILEVGTSITVVNGARIFVMDEEHEFREW